MNSQADLRARVPLPYPPAINTWPLASLVAVERFYRRGR